MRRTARARRHVARELTTDNEKTSYRSNRRSAGGRLGADVEPTRERAGVAQGPQGRRGAGYQAGDFQIHPGIAGEIGYDSNYLGRSDKTGPASTSAPGYLANGAPGYPPADSAELRITPSLSVRMVPAGQRSDGTPAPPPPVSFGFGASGTYPEFFASGLQNQRNMSAAANATLGILPGREWSGSISASYTRIIQPTVLGDPDLSYNNDMVSVGADLATQPNQGTLDWHFGYTFTGTFFEQSSGDPYNNQLHTGYTRGRWRFRPRTALIYDGQISVRNFSDTNGAAFVLHQATPVRAKIGLEGLVTPRFSILGMIGYGATLSERLNSADFTAEQYDSIIGTVELRFFPGGQPNAPSPDAKPSLLVSTIALGYTRDFQASYLDDFYGLDRGYLRAEYFFAGRFLVTLQGGVGAYEHPDLYFGTGLSKSPVIMAKSYTDIGADATLFLEYRVLPSVGINATGTYVENFSNTQLPVAPESNQVFDLNVRRITTFLGVRWFM